MTKEEAAELCRQAVKPQIRLLQQQRRPDRNKDSDGPNDANNERATAEIGRV